MITKQLVTAWGAALISSMALSECNKPIQPSLPDGSTAKLEVLQQAQQEVKRYISDGNEYLACLDKEEAIMKTDNTSTLETEAARIADYNLVVEAMKNSSKDWKKVVSEYSAR